MRALRLVLAAVLLVIACLAVRGEGDGPVHAGTQPDVYMIGQSSCFAIALHFTCLEVQDDGALFAYRDQWRSVVLDRNHDQTVLREEVATLDVEAHQLHQNDGAAAIVLFVSSDAPLQFSADRGLFKVSNAVNDTAFLCSQHPTAQFAGFTEDEDCDNDGIVGDGLVFAQLLGSAAPAGPGTVTVTNALTSDVVAILQFTVVREATSLQVVTTGPAVENGLTAPGDCQMPREINEIASIDADPNKAILIVRALNDDGSPIAGAWFRWTTTSQFLKLGAPESYTLDLGPPYGIAAINVVCGLDSGAADITGTVDVRTVVGPAGGISIDPGVASDAHSIPISCDADRDQLCDRYERARTCLTIGEVDSFTDPDADGLQTLDEYQSQLEPCDPDTDGDGCSEPQEFGADPAAGGGRDPRDFWDFFDVNGDRGVDLRDTLAILARFGSSPGSPLYDPIYDRYVPSDAPPYQTAAATDGITLTDVVASLGSFGHDCSARP